MQQHPTIGRDILANIDNLAPAAELVYSHHEHYDGGGYPRGLAAEAIPLGARIFMVVDAVDAITSDRSYHKGASLKVAIEHLQDQSGRTFDPAVVNALVEHQNAFAALMVKLTSQASIGFDESALVSDIQTRPSPEKWFSFQHQQEVTGVNEDFEIIFSAATPNLLTPYLPTELDCDLTPESERESPPCRQLHSPSVVWPKLPGLM